MTATSPTFITNRPSCPACHGPTGDGRCINASCAFQGFHYTLAGVLNFLPTGICAAFIGLYVWYIITLFN